MIAQKKSKKNRTTKKTVDFTQSDYLNRDLIAYLGNKRRLLTFLGHIFDHLKPEPEGCVFLDPFAGSGSVSRLARSMGFKTLSNDWEYYSFIINSCHIGLNRRQLADFFTDKGGITAVFDYLNRLSESDPRPDYIARNYAPAATNAPDFQTERLFYTRENALFIDETRNQIEAWYPEKGLFGQAKQEKHLLLAALLYQCATHVNTSGVFKAFHRGFGGYGRDALKRIMAPMSLRVPRLTDRGSGRAYDQEAVQFLKRHSGEICYLDPPYNSHQYGSNYHLLNTVALWDCPPLDNSTDASGRLRQKAGIRGDWLKTRSAFCYRKTAPEAFSELLDAADCRYLVVSYSTDGVVPLEELFELLGRRGRCELFIQNYQCYRGGRQSIDRRDRNLEFCLVVKRDEIPRSNQKNHMKRFFVEQELLSLLDNTFHPLRLARRFAREGNDLILWRQKKQKICLPLEADSGFAEKPSADQLKSMPDPALRSMVAALKWAVCRDRQEESEVLLKALIADNLTRPQNRRLTARYVRVLKKFAHKKYQPIFEDSLSRVKKAINEKPEQLAGVAACLPELQAVCRRRFAEKRA